jgi:glycosyltransferase involved in cell wall biosynthesis
MPRSMRIVMDARYAGPGPSGIGAYVRAVAARVPSLAPDLRFDYWIRPGTARLSAAPNVTERFVRRHPAGLSTLLVPRSLGPLAADDVFHGPANVLGLGLPRRTIATVHDVMWIEHLAWCQPRPYLRPISKRYYTTGILRALRHARRILTVSRASADAIVRGVPSAHGRIVVTPNACDARFAPPASLDAARRAAARHLGFEAPFFLVVGQNQPSKAHPVALRAFAGARVGDHRLVLVQRLEAGRGLSALARSLGAGGRVHFAESLPEDALVALYQAATALVQPSLAEGFGLPVLEAMASGCPVVASDIPPLSEVLGGAGVLAPPGAVEGFRDALEALVSSPSRLTELRERGLSRARDFSWDRTAARTLEVYREVLSS